MSHLLDVSVLAACAWQSHTAIGSKKSSTTLKTALRRHTCRLF